MDLRKQKRLGPAPIASFEKSFEDTTSPLTSSVYATVSATPATVTQCSTNINFSHTQNIHDFGSGNKDAKDVMDTKDSPTKKTVTNMPDTIISADVSGAASKHIDINNSRYVTATSTIKRAPPLKSTTTSHSNAMICSYSSNTGGDIGAGDVAYSFRGTASLCTPLTPRIELSRASSSSHQEDSRDSSPENVFEQVGTGTLQETLDMGFREEGALELRSSTEELYFMDPAHKKEEEAKFQQQQQQQLQITAQNGSSLGMLLFLQKKEINSIKV